jgi:hypothetical protein
MIVKSWISGFAWPKIVEDSQSYQLFRIQSHSTDASDVLVLDETMPVYQEHDDCVSEASSRKATDTDYF